MHSILFLKARSIVLSINMYFLVTIRAKRVKRRVKICVKTMTMTLIKTALRASDEGEKYFVTLMKKRTNLKRG